MRKVEAQALDSIDDYRLIEAEVPSPGPGQVLVEVAACGVGYADVLVALGRYQVKPPLPHTPGQEAAGRIAAIGADVTGLAVGDRVMAAVRGGFAEFALASAAGVRKIPERMSFEAACGFHVNYVTALHGLADRGAVAPGETVVVLGAAGGVGAAGLQVAKLLGARVVAVASSEAKRAFCRELGADATLDTEPEGWRERLKGACGDKAPDVVFDPVCGPLFEPAFRSLGWRGRHLVLGFVGGPIPSLRANLPLMKGAALIGVDVRQFMLFEGALARAHADRLLAWVASGDLDPPVGRRFRLDEFAAALAFGLTGQGLGKTVIMP